MAPKKRKSAPNKDPNASDDIPPATVVEEQCEDDKSDAEPEIIRGHDASDSEEDDTPRLLDHTDDLEAAQVESRLEWNGFYRQYKCGEPFYMAKTKNPDDTYLCYA